MPAKPTAAPAKAGGVCYTPNYIVRLTVGKLLDVDADTDPNLLAPALRGERVPEGLVRGGRCASGNLHQTGNR